jgi:hypothetical protein
MAQRGTASITQNGHPAHPRVFAPAANSAPVGIKRYQRLDPALARRAKTACNNVTSHSNRHSLSINAPAPTKINRQACRSETTVSPTKQTPARHINRQLSATSPHSLRRGNFRLSITECQRRKAQARNRSRSTNRSRQFTNHRSPITIHESQSGAPKGTMLELFSEILCQACNSLSSPRD